jgi:hypothetical protein
VREVGILRMLQVKNPWARRPWKGRFSLHDKDTRWTDGLRRALGLTNMAKFKEMEGQGVFWIEFGDVRKYFRSFFLNCKYMYDVYRTGQDRTGHWSSLV